MQAEKFIDKELLNSLPKDKKFDPTGLRLAKLINSISNKKVPVNSFSRIWTLGSLQARIQPVIWPIGCAAALPMRIKSSGSRAKPIWPRPCNSSAPWVTCAVQ